MDDQFIIDGLEQKEQSFHYQIKQLFLDMLSEMEDTAHNCIFTSIKNGDGVSISFFDEHNKSFWVYREKRSIKLQIKSIYTSFVDSMDALYGTCEPNKEGRFSERFGHLNELHQFDQVICDIYTYRELEAKGRLFDCCHRYEECSDARDCTHPDKDFRMRCSYRRKLKNGIIFFGKNRNIS